MTRQEAARHAGYRNRQRAALRRAERYDRMAAEHAKRAEWWAGQNWAQGTEAAEACRETAASLRDCAQIEREAAERYGRQAEAVKAGGG